MCNHRIQARAIERGTAPEERHDVGDCEGSHYGHGNDHGNLDAHLPRFQARGSRSKRSHGMPANSDRSTSIGITRSVPGMPSSATVMLPSPIASGRSMPRARRIVPKSGDGPSERISRCTRATPSQPALPKTDDVETSTGLSILISTGSSPASETMDATVSRIHAPIEPPNTTSIRPRNSAERCESSSNDAPYDSSSVPQSLPASPNDSDRAG